MKFFLSVAADICLHNPFCPLEINERVKKTRVAHKILYNNMYDRVSRVIYIMRLGVVINQKQRGPFDHSSFLDLSLGLFVRFERCEK
jgi:hypothetical protein